MCVYVCVWHKEMASCDHKEGGVKFGLQQTSVHILEGSTPLGSQSEQRRLRRSVVASGSSLINCLPYFFMFTSACTVTYIYGARAELASHYYHIVIESHVKGEVD